MVDSAPTKPGPQKRAVSTMVPFRGAISGFREFIHSREARFPPQFLEGCQFLLPKLKGAPTKRALKREPPHVHNLACVKTEEPLQWMGSFGFPVKPYHMVLPKKRHPNGSLCVFVTPLHCKSAGMTSPRWLLRGQVTGCPDSFGSSREPIAPFLGVIFG